MKRTFRRIVLLAAVGAFVFLTGCSTLDVRFPGDLYVSTGDYVPGVTTLGLIQETTVVFAPLFIVDINKVNQALYEKLIKRVQALGADGITDIRFYQRVSPLTWGTVFIASG